MENRSKGASKTPATVPEVDANGTGDLSGRTLGDFRVIRPIGRGGMGQVYLAEQLSLKRKVALKLVRADLPFSENARKRFRIEAEAAAGLSHANIVQVYAFGETDGMLYMAMEFVEGWTLRDFVEKKGPPDLTLTISIMRQAAAALSRSGEVGIVHRDIKPDNILLTRKGEVKIADFGLAKRIDDAQPLNLTQSGIVMGTPLYMSPEQVEGKAVDCRTDLYSFGITCYHMLTGAPPYTGATAVEVALQHIQGQPVPLAKTRPDLPEALCTIVHKLMAKDLSQRYQTGKDLLRDVIRLRDTVTAPGSAVPPPLPLLETAISVELTPVLVPTTPFAGLRAFPPPWLRQHWLPIAIGLSLLAALGAGAALALSRRAVDPPLAAKPSIEPAADVKQIKELLSSKKDQEKTRRELAEQYINPPAGSKDFDPRSGYGLCMDLGLFYLDEHRYTDAADFYARLRGSIVPTYQHLGRLGGAISLAMQNRPRESNAMFHEAMRSIGIERWVDKGKPTGKKAAIDQTWWVHPRLRYWMAEALYYNSRNGVRDDEIPRGLQKLREMTANAKGK